MKEKPKPTPSEPTQPWFTVELDGVVLNVPMGEGKIFTLPMTSDGLYALIGDGVERWTHLKGNTELQKKMVQKVGGWLIDRLAGKR